MKQVLFLGGPFHEQVREVEDPYRPVRFTVPPKKDVKVSISDEQSYFYDDALFGVEEYIVKDAIVFGIRVHLQVTPEWYTLASSWMAEKCLQGLGFRK